MEVKSDLNARLALQHTQVLEDLQDKLSAFETQTIDLKRKLEVSEKTSSTRLMLVEGTANYLPNQVFAPSFVEFIMTLMTSGP